MSRVVSIDGAVVPPERAVVSVFDRGFLYGDGAFESLRTYRGRPFGLEEHLSRLSSSLATLRMRAPVSMADLASEVLLALRAALADGVPSEHYLRIMVTRGVGPLGLAFGAATRSTRVVLVEPLAPPSVAVYRDGLAAVSVNAPAPVLGGGAKLLPYLTNLLLLEAARDQGAGEAILVDARGHVREGATSNVFIARGGRLSTPRAERDDRGVLPGITRAFVLEGARDEGLEVTLEDLTLHALASADEAFLTSSIREVIPLVRLDGRPIGDGTPGPLTRRLHRAYRARAGVTEVPWEEPPSLP